MIIIPVGRDSAEVRRDPWICWAIIAANVAVFVLATIATQRGSHALDAKGNEVVRFLVDHPYLEIPSVLAPHLSEDFVKELRAAGGAPSRLLHEREQDQLDAMASELHAMLESTPEFRWGYIPAAGSAITMVTSMFVHAGFLHLIGNLLFFFVTAPFLEDVYGRIAFPILYFAGGFAATITFAAQHPTAMQPLIGASGAIAAVMGAYLVRFFRSRLEFLCLPFILPVFSFRFFLPAFVVLPLWFAEQAFLASKENSSTDVAFSAHAGGFVFGLLFGLAMKLTGFEEKHVQGKVEAQTTWKESELYLRAVEAADRDDWMTARQLLDELLQAEPGNVNALSAAVDAGCRLRDAAYASRHAVRLLEVHVKVGEEELATQLIHSALVDWQCEADIRFLARAAVFAEKTADMRLALEVHRRIAAARPDGAAAVPALLRTARVLHAHGDDESARTALRKASDLPGISIDSRDAVLNLLATMEESPWA